MAEHEQTTALSRLHDDFARARGVDLDGTWATGVSWRLLRRDVAPRQVADALEEALALVRDTGESPEDLYGTSQEHADALHRRWVEEGRLHLRDDGGMAWTDVPAWSLGGAAATSLALMTAFLLDGVSELRWTPAHLLLPLGISTATVAALALWGTLLRTRRRAVTLAATAATVALAATGIAVLAEWSTTHPIGTASTWAYVPLAAAFAALAALASRWAATRPAPSDPRDSDLGELGDWSADVAEILRTRHTLPERRVRRIVADATAHAAEVGHPVEDEFGTAEDYAARFAPDTRRRLRLEAVIWVVLGLSTAVWLLDEVDLVRVVVAASALVIAWRTWRRSSAIRT